MDGVPAGDGSEGVCKVLAGDLGEALGYKACFEA